MQIEKLTQIDNYKWFEKIIPEIIKTLNRINIDNSNKYLYYERKMVLVY